MASVLPHLEEADLSGQTEIGADGWAAICNEIRRAAEEAAKEDAVGLDASTSGTASAPSGTFRLRLLRVGGCRLKDDTRKALEDLVAAKSQQLGFRVDFGPADIEDGSKDGRRKKCCCCC